MLWEYTDNRGIVQRGTVEKTSDHGGSDVTYFFRRETGELDVLNGVYMKRTNAHPIYTASERIRAAREEG